MMHVGVTANRAARVNKRSTKTRKPPLPTQFSALYRRRVGLAFLPAADEFRNLVSALMVLAAIARLYSIATFSGSHCSRVLFSTATLNRAIASGRVRRSLGHCLSWEKMNTRCSSKHQLK
jgi:hypothetical protein